MVRGNTPSASVVTRLSHYRANATSWNSISGERPADGGVRGHHRAAPSPPSFTESLARYDTSDFKSERKYLLRILLNPTSSWLSEPSSPGFIRGCSHRMAHASAGSVFSQRIDSSNWLAAVGSCFARAARARYPRWKADQRSSVGPRSHRLGRKRGVRGPGIRRDIFQGDGQACDPRCFIEVSVCHISWRNVYTATEWISQLGPY